MWTGILVSEMWFGLITLFPEMYQCLEVGGITQRAKKNGLVDWALVNPRDFAFDAHQTVDDRPYGGGPGMVLKAEPLMHAVRVAKLRAPEPPKVICLSPSGNPLTQKKARELSQMKSLILVSGRYEGIDQRFVDQVDEELSIGDYVLSGGELASMVVIDAITRLLPGAVSTQASVVEDSFTSANLLDWPHYTRPETVGGQRVPDVLLSGDHQAIKQWRMKQAASRTRDIRPDLLKEQSRAIVFENETMVKASIDSQ